MEHPVQKALQIHLNVSDGKMVFEALAELPFKYVYDLIGKLNHQANLNHAKGGGESTLFKHSLGLEEIALIIKALGGLPFNRVHRLLDKLEAQIRQQLPN